MADSHFDSAAQTWDDDPAKVARADDIARGIRAALTLGGHERLLEYGAGTGLLAQALAGDVGAITLADSSAGMRAVAKEKVEAGVLPEGTRVWDLDLSTTTPPEEQFDLVVTSLVLHHIRDLTPVLAGFHALTAPGGHVAIADLDSEDGSFHAHLHDFDGHDGFDRHGLSRDLEAAGFVEVWVSDCAEVDKDGTVFPVFLAVARRA